MNTEQIEIVPPKEAKFTMTWTPETQRWRAAFEGVMTLDAVILGLASMQFELQLMKHHMGLEQQAKEAMVRVDVAGTCPPPPNFAHRR